MSSSGVVSILGNGAPNVVRTLMKIPEQPDFLYVGKKKKKTISFLFPFLFFFFYIK